MTTFDFNGSSITIDSPYGFGEEQEMKDLFYTLQQIENSGESISELVKELSYFRKREEILEEQIYFASNLVNEIEDTIEEAGDKPLKSQAIDSLNSIRQSINDSMFER